MSFCVKCKRNQVSNPKYILCVYCALATLIIVNKQQAEKKGKYYYKWKRNYRTGVRLALRKMANGGTIPKQSPTGNPASECVDLGESQISDSMAKS